MSLNQRAPAEEICETHMQQMEHTATVPAKQVAFDLACWYHELARLCVRAAEQHLDLDGDSTEEEFDRAVAINEVINVRMAAVRSCVQEFRTEFPRLYIDHQVDRILRL